MKTTFVLLVLCLFSLPNSATAGHGRVIEIVAKPACARGACAVEVRPIRVLRPVRRRAVTTVERTKTRSVVRRGWLWWRR